MLDQVQKTWPVTESVMSSLDLETDCIWKSEVDVVVVVVLGGGVQLYLRNHYTSQGTLCDKLKFHIVAATTYSLYLWNYLKKELGQQHAFNSLQSHQHIIHLSLEV